MNLTESIEKEYASIKETEIKLLPNKNDAKQMHLLTEAYASWLKEAGFNALLNRSYEKNLRYEDAINRLRKIKKTYSSEQIVQFCSLLNGYQSQKLFSVTGFFLSALINMHYAAVHKTAQENKEYILFTEHLEKKIDYIGYLANGAHIHIVGDAGLFLGKDMKSGRITILGNTGSSPGFGMNGGAITIRHNAGPLVGNYMNGGEIHIDGGYRSISDQIYGGRIFHRGNELSFSKINKEEIMITPEKMTEAIAKL